MSYQSHPSHVRTPVDAAVHFAQLQQVLRLVEELGGAAHGDADDGLDQAARHSSSYAGAEPIDRRRFDILARETASWSAAGIEALVAAGPDRSPAAARQLAAEIAASLDRLGACLDRKAH